MITITSTADHVEVDMGALYPAYTHVKRGLWRKDQVQMVLQNTNHIEIDASDGRDWLINWDGNGPGFQVATIDGVAPTSHADLYEKLKSLVVV